MLDKKFLLMEFEEFVYIYVCVWVLFPLSIYVYVCMCRYYTTICCLLKRQMFCLDCTLFNSFVLHFREFIFCVDANNANVHSQTTDLDKDGVCTFFFKYALKCNNTKKMCRTKKIHLHQSKQYSHFLRLSTVFAG